VPVIVIANPKGGVGKSTLATNLAGCLARQGHRVMLGDIDAQQSSRSWLALRPPGLPAIAAWDLGPDRIARPPRGVTHVVLDTPAGMAPAQLQRALRIADRLIVPLQPSMFDILATQAFLEQLPALPPRARIGVIGMRVDARTRAAEQLSHYVGQLGMPVLGYLRDTQNYVQLAAMGATLWDAAPSRVERDIAQWQDLLRWIET
jgi:chromosome partitioning protein